MYTDDELDHYVYLKILRFVHNITKHMAPKGHCSLPRFLFFFSTVLSCSVLRILNSSRKFLHSSLSLKQFSEVLNSSRKFQTVHGTFRQFSEVLTVLGLSQYFLGSSAISVAFVDRCR